MAGSLALLVLDIRTGAIETQAADLGGEKRKETLTHQNPSKD